MAGDVPFAGTQTRGEGGSVTKFGHTAANLVAAGAPYFYLFSPSRHCTDRGPLRDQFTW